MFVPAAAARHQAAARELRGRGWSLRRIAGHLGVSLSSASVWTRDVGPVLAPPAPMATPEAEEERRRCSRCARTRPLSSFNRHGDGHQWWCRECFRGYYREGQAYHRARTNALKASRVAEAQAFVLAQLDGAGCTDCAESDPVVLEFDHLGAKRADVATLVRRGVLLPRIAAELERCEVVCANCHRRRTAVRARWSRLDGELVGVSWRSPRHERNVRHAVAALAASGCVDCGEHDLCVLDFDHVGARTGAVMRLARNEVSLARLAAEIAACEVRCATCHRRRTAVAGGYFRAQFGVPPARVELALPA
jgi:hypothetical protein